MKYNIVITDEYPKENDPIVIKLRNGISYEEALEECRKTMESDAEMDAADDAHIMTVFWDGESGEILYTDGSKNSYKVREVEEMTGLERLNEIKWNTEDLEEALIAAGKEPTESNREKLEQMINNGFIGTIIEEINEKLEILAENT